MTFHPHLSALFWTRCGLVSAALGLIALHLANPAAAAPAEQTVDGSREARTGFYLVLEDVEQQRKALEAEAYRREKVCIDRFFSARCLEDLRQERLRRLEALRTREVLAQRGLRELDAVQREASREARRAGD